MSKVAIFWFRRDLRLHDNAGLYHALTSGHPVLPIFIFDPTILEGLPKDDARVSFIHQRLKGLHQQLSKLNAPLAVYHGTPKQIFQQLWETHKIASVFTNHDYEPYAQKRDAGVQRFLNEKGIIFNTYKDQVIFEKGDICKDDGSPYVVFTPYMKKWKSVFNAADPIPAYVSQSMFANLAKGLKIPFLELDTIGFTKSPIEVADPHLSTDFLEKYHHTREYPALENGTSRLGVHLRFGTVSVREIVKMALGATDDTFLHELIWREFFMQILWHFPKTTTHAFKPKYDRITWRNHAMEFERWQKGETGFPLVDAGMRELNATGYMHNRVRMLTASFLCKHLLIDWRWGEAYFAEKLLDYEMASNVGNWQWAAGSGVDAAPYFRIFNPTTQIKKFDKELDYVRHWVPDFQELSYPQPMVDHRFARERCLATYKKALD
ncbi:MAG: deoxyribodipyrimidine photo-lyase [Flavobacteriaceae bacterium]